jgi:hypothetical protein
VGYYAVAEKDAPAERCGSDSCGICTAAGRDYRAMHWWPQPVLSSYDRSEQVRGLRFWFLTREDMIGALGRPAP